MKAVGGLVSWARGADKTALLAKYSSVFDFEAVDIHEQNQKLSQYKGNVTLIVNVASF